MIRPPNRRGYAAADASAAKDGSKRVKAVYGWALLAFAMLAFVVGVLEAAGKGPRPDTALHFDSGSEYSIHETRLNWFIVAAASVSAVVNFAKYQAKDQQPHPFWVYCWAPIVMPLIIVDLAALSRVRDGFILALLCFLTYVVSMIEITGVIIVSATGKFQAGMEGEPGGMQDEHVATGMRVVTGLRIWTQLVAACGWGLIMTVIWYTASWSERTIGDITPNYVVPVLAISTSLIGVLKVAQIAGLLHYTPCGMRAWLRETILVAAQFSLLAICAFVPMF